MIAVRVMATTVVIAFGVATATVAAWTEPHFTKLTGAQIKAKLAGMEMTDQSPALAPKKEETTSLSHPLQKAPAQGQGIFLAIAASPGSQFAYAPCPGCDQ